MNLGSLSLRLSVQNDSLHSVFRSVSFLRTNSKSFCFLCLEEPMMNHFTTYGKFQYVLNRRFSPILLSTALSQAEY